jgi:hypothetical protein
MLRVGEAIEEAIGGAKNGESNFRSVNEMSEAFVVTLACFAEENGLDGAAGTEGFFDQADAFHANGARLRR